MTTLEDEVTDLVVDAIWTEEPKAAVPRLLAIIDRERAAERERAPFHQEPVAYAYELADAVQHHSDGGRTYVDFDSVPRLSINPPCVPEGSMRNLRALYAGPLPKGQQAAAIRTTPPAEVEGGRDNG